MAAAAPTVSRTVNGTGHGGDTDYVMVIPDVSNATIGDIHRFAAAL